MPKRPSKDESAPVTSPEIALDAILSFLKDTRGTVSWSMKDLRDCLKLDAKQAQQALAILEMQGYIAREGGDWLTTSAGETISKSKKPQFAPGKVSEALDTLKERIEAVNRDKRAEFRIVKAVAFGDFLSGRAQVQAADVGLMLARRTTVSTNESKEEDENTFLKQLTAKNRLVHVQRYQPWMSERSHRNLL